MELLIILLVASGLVFLLYKVMFKEQPSASAVAIATSTAPVEDATQPVINKVTGQVVDNSLDLNKDSKNEEKNTLEPVKKTRTRVKKADTTEIKITKTPKIIETKVKPTTKETPSKPRGRTKKLTQ